MADKIKIIEEDSNVERVALFKQQILDTMEKRNITEVKMKIPDLRDFFGYTGKSQENGYWFPRQIRDECTAQNLSLKKIRNFNIAVIKLIKKKNP